MTDWEGEASEILESHGNLYDFDPADIEQVVGIVLECLEEHAIPPGLAAMALVKALTLCAAQFDNVDEVLDDAVAMIDTFLQLEAEKEEDSEEEEEEL